MLLLPPHAGFAAVQPLRAQIQQLAGAGEVLQRALIGALGAQPGSPCPLAEFLLSLVSQVLTLVQFPLPLIRLVLPLIGKPLALVLVLLALIRPPEPLIRLLLALIRLPLTLVESALARIQRLAPIGRRTAGPGRRLRAFHLASMRPPCPPAPRPGARGMGPGRRMTVNP